MNKISWRRDPPNEPCPSPHGHSPVNVMSEGKTIPDEAYCMYCDRQYTIVTWKKDDLS